jgi:hypothetical protein
MMTKATVFIALGGAVSLGILGLVAQTQNGREDCVPYTPSALRLVDEGDRGWLIGRTDGARFIGLDSKEDADLMMAVFKAHSALCYVGRDNKRPNHRDFVHMYWK